MTLQTDYIILITTELTYGTIKIGSPLNKSAQFSSICMRSSQSCPFLLHYRSRRIISFDRCISFEKKGEKIQGQLIFPICVQQLQYVHYLQNGRHLNAINGVEVKSMERNGKGSFVSEHKIRWGKISRLGLLRITKDQL